MNEHTEPVPDDAAPARNPFILDADEFVSKVIELQDRIGELQTTLRISNDTANRAIEEGTTARQAIRAAERDLMALVGIDRWAL